MNSLSRGGAVLNKVIVITTVITYTILSNNIMMQFFLINHCCCRYTNFVLNIILPLNGLRGGTKLQLQGCYTSIWGAFWGFNQYCICNYYGGVWLLLIVTTTFIRNTKRSVRDLFSSRTTCLRCHLYCICDSYASLFFYLLLLPICL